MKRTRYFYLLKPTPEESFNRLKTRMELYFRFQKLTVSRFEDGPLEVIKLEFLGDTTQCNRVSDYMNGFLSDFDM